MLPAAANAADTVIRAEKLHSSANLSYKVAGKRYTPLTKVSSFSQTGKASWYGNQFHGRKTASGERYDMNALTAAHRTLPIPSYARVTNTKNGKSVIVRVNDRGPFHGSRVMDVSKAAAQKLGFISQGTTHIKIEQVLPGSETAMSDMPKKDIYVDLKSFGSESEALAYMNQTGRNLSSADMASKVSVEKRGGSYVVRMGPFVPTKPRAARAWWCRTLFEPLCGTECQRPSESWVFRRPLIARAVRSIGTAGAGARFRPVAAIKV